MLIVYFLSGRAYAGQLRYFLASEAGCSPPTSRGQADIGGSDAPAPVAEKIAQLLPSDFVLGHIDLEVEIQVAVFIPG